jgi:hypothetical protein
MTTATPAIAQAKNEIAAAWQAYQKVEKYGLEFGKTVYTWREKFKSKAGCKSKGQGILPILEQLGIPTSTAYWWVNKHEVSLGLRAPDPQKELEDYEDEDFDDDFLSSDLYEPPTEAEQRRIDKMLEDMAREAPKREAWARERERREQGVRDYSAVPTDVRVVCKEIVESGYRVLAKERHPDVGGSATDMVRLNAAVTCLRRII